MYVRILRIAVQEQHLIQSSSLHINEFSLNFTKHKIFLREILFSLRFTEYTSVKCDFLGTFFFLPQIQKIVHYIRCGFETSKHTFFLGIAVASIQSFST